MVALLIAVHVLVTAAAPSSAEDHLLAGAQAFREARYGEALVEFRVAQDLGAADAAGYVAASLVKLGRAEEAVEAFGTVHDLADDALLGYYRAIACYDARLYVCADRLLAEVGDRAGPRIAEQVRKIRAAIAAELSREPSRASVDWYLERCTAPRGEARPVLTSAYCDEAIAIAGKRADRYRLGEAAARRASLPGLPPKGPR